jgi:acetolactate synthase-1/2/3 large subunit
MEDKIVRNNTDGSSIVTAALAQYLKVPVHTLFQVSISGALVAGVYSGVVSVNRAHRSDLAVFILQAIAGERAELSRESATRKGTPIHPLRLIAELQPFLSSDVALWLDMGSFDLWLARHLYSFKARQILISNGQQTLGVALLWAIAASKCACV